MQKNIEIVGNIKMSIWSNGCHREQSYVMSMGGGMVNTQCYIFKTRT